MPIFFSLQTIISKYSKVQRPKLYIIFGSYFIIFFLLKWTGHRTTGEVFCILSKSGLEFFFYSDHFWYGSKIVHVDTKYDKNMKKRSIVWQRPTNQILAFGNNFCARVIWSFKKDFFFVFVRKCLHSFWTFLLGGATVTT